MDFKYLKKKWDKPVVLRKEIGVFSQGIIKPNYLALLDHQGKGPKRYQVCGKIAYNVNDFISWLEERTHIING